MDNKKFLVTSFVAMLALAQGLTAASRHPLSFEERVQAQEAIERVYYAHRIWPKENPGPKPAFDQVVPRAVIEAKVTDYLKKCNALDTFWQRPITGEQLQTVFDAFMTTAAAAPDNAFLCAPPAPTTTYRIVLASQRTFPPSINPE